jgi:hypothetical protein
MCEYAIAIAQEREKEKVDSEFVFFATYSIKLFALRICFLFCQTAIM